MTSFPYAVKCARANKVIRAMLSPHVIAVTVGIERKKNAKNCELGALQPRGSQMAKTPLEIASLARMHTKKAVKTLAAIMNEPHAPYAARVAAAEALLDRGWGKPRQSHEAEITHRYVIEIPALMDNATWEAEALEHEPDKLQ